MAWYKRKELSMILTSAIIVIFIVDYNLNIPTLKAVTNELSSWGTVIAAFAIGLGYINLFQYYGNKVNKRESGWIYSAWLLIATSIVSILGIMQGSNGSITGYIYNNVLASLDGSFFSLTALYMSSAAYRAFKFRSVESFLLLISAFLVVLKNAPVGEVVWGGFNTLGTFLLNNPTMGVSRGIGLGMSMASIAMALRIMTGKEYSFLAGTSEEGA